MSFIVAALYKFTCLKDVQGLQKKLLDLGIQHGLKGTLLLASEGINGTVSGTREGIDALGMFLKLDGRFDEMEYKESSAQTNPFYRYKVRLKKEIVTMGVSSVDPTKRVGQYVNPQDWNALISDPDVLVVDTRNDYEIQIGTFKGAISPETKSFREFPEFVRTHLKDRRSQKIALSCTGGIRCEKATSFLLDEGFEEVYHLKGGILKYLETVPPEESLWEGECFVFDHRVALKEGLDHGDHHLCFGCRAPLAPEDLRSDFYEAGVACPKCHEVTSDEKKERARSRQRQIMLAKSRGESHIGSRVF